MKDYLQSNYKSIAIILAVSIIGFIFLLYYILTARPIVPYMDAISFITYYGKFWHENFFNIFKNWQYGQQSGLVDQVTTYLNIKFFSLNSLFFVTLNALLISIIFYAISVQIIKNESSNAIRPFLLLGIFLTVFSLNGWELLLLDFGGGEILRNLFYLITALFIYSSIISRAYDDKLPKSSSLFIYTLLLIFTILLIGTGEVWAFATTIFITILLFQPWSHLKRGLMLTYGLISLLPLIILYIYHYLSTISSNNFGGMNFSISNIILQLPMAFASAMIDLDTVNKYHIQIAILFFCGIFLIISYLYSLILIVVLKEDKRKYFIPIFISLYGILTGISIVIARGSIPGQSVMASRYYINYMFFVIGLLWILYLLITTNKDLNKENNFNQILLIKILASKNIRRILFFVTFFLIIFSQILSIETEIQIAPYRAYNYLKMGKVYCKGYNNISEEDSVFLQTRNKNFANQATYYMELYKLGPYSIGGICGG